MIISRARIAAAMIGLAKSIAPSDRKEWFDGMVAEFDHMPRQELLPFALGCLTTSVRLRARTREFALAAVRLALVVGAIMWSLAHIWFALRIWPEDVPLLVTASLVTAAIFAAGAVVTARFGLRVTTSLAVPALFTGTLVILFLLVFAAPGRSSEALTALLIEDVLMLVAAIVIAKAAQSYAAFKTREPS